VTQTLNLFLAVFWLFLGLGLIILHWLYPQVRPGRLFGTDLSMGWIALVLSAYNLVRWWSLRSYVAQRRVEQEAFEQRRRALEHERRRPEQEPDPNLNFTESPPRHEDTP
jgi:hypothetical protein